MRVASVVLIFLSVLALATGVTCVEEYSDNLSTGHLVLSNVIFLSYLSPHAALEYCFADAICLRATSTRCRSALDKEVKNLYKKPTGLGVWPAGICLCHLPWMSPCELCLIDLWSCGLVGKTGKLSRGVAKSSVSRRTKPWLLCGGSLAGLCEECSCFRFQNGGHLGYFSSLLSRPWREEIYIHLNSKLTAFSWEFQQWLIIPSRSLFTTFIQSFRSHLKIKFYGVPRRIKFCRRPTSYYSNSSATFQSCHVLVVVAWKRSSKSWPLSRWQ